MSIIAAVSFENVPGIRDAVRELVVPSMILADAVGEGKYEGKSEQTAVLLIEFPDYSASLLARLYLADIAAEYGQEAIGFTSADSETTLVKAASTPAPAPAPVPRIERIAQTYAIGTEARQAGYGINWG